IGCQIPAKSAWEVSRLGLGSVASVAADDQPVEAGPAVADPVDLVLARHAHQSLLAGAGRVDVGVEDLLRVGPRVGQDLAVGAGERALADEAEPPLLTHPVDG